MGKFVPLIAALLAGVVAAVQGPVNTELSRHVGQFRAIFISVLVTFISVLAIIVIQAGDGSFAGLGHTPRWALIGGLMGLVSLAGAIIAVPRIGAAATTGAIVAGQVITSAVIDRFGLLGVVVRPLTPLRLTGLALLALAVGMVMRG